MHELSALVVGAGEVTAVGAVWGRVVVTVEEKLAV